MKHGGRLLSMQYHLPSINNPVRFIYFYLQLQRGKMLPNVVGVQHVHQIIICLWGDKSRLSTQTAFSFLLMSEEAHTER